MVEIRFTQHLARYGDATPMRIEGRTLRELLEAVFAARPNLRSFLVDERGALRPHVVVFIDGCQAEDREGLGDPVEDGVTVDVLQALSGG